MIVNEQKQVEYASKFRKEGDAYIHIEAHKNGGAEIMVAGDIMGIMLAINLLINKMQKKTGASFKELIELIMDNQKLIESYDYTPRMQEKTIIDGEVKEIEETQLKKKIKELEKNLAIIEKEKKNMEIKFNMSLGVKERQLEEEKKKVKELSMQVLDLDHENERLSNLLQER